MVTQIENKNTKRFAKGAFVAREAGDFRVWGTLEGVAFDKVFGSVKSWRSWKRVQQMQRKTVEVRGMHSVAAA